MFPTPNRATLSIRGLYEYDDTIFSKMVFPSELANADRLLVIDNILVECAELELLFPDWDFMNDAIEMWSKTELPTWERVYRVALAEYNPIENYDRHEDAVDTENRKRDTTRNDNITNSSTGNSVNTNEDTLKVAGYNSEALGNKNKTVQNGTNAVSNSGESQQTFTEGETDNTGRVRSSRIHGNIGVTTTQHMIEEEITLAPKINIIKYIVKSFEQRFCLLVY